MRPTNRDGFGPKIIVKIHRMREARISQQNHAICRKEGATLLYAALGYSKYNKMRTKLKKKNLAVFSYT